MRKTTYIINFINSRKELKNNNNNGFSLIELVVAVGILAILSVIGVVAYSQIMKRAEMTAVDSVVLEVYTVITSAVVDGDERTDPQKIADDLEVSFAQDNYVIDYIPANSTTNYQVTVTNLDTGYTSSLGGHPIR